MHEMTKNRQVKVACKQAYQVFLVTESSGDCCTILNDLLGNQQRLVVTSPTVSSLYAQKIWKNIRADAPNDSFVVLGCDENTKNIDQVIRVCQQAQKVQLGRQGIIVAIGGGVCMDIVTVAASWLHRGINYIKVPTTLTGQVDAGIGIKGTVNFNGQKSYLGCFHPPTAAIINPQYLQTLPLKHLRTGVSEILKMAIICDQQLFNILEEQQKELLASGFQEPQKSSRDVLWRAITAMLSELEINMYEDYPYQRKADFGHTFSSAFEEHSGFELAHGEAVAVDIAVSTVLACQMRLLNWEAGKRIISLLLDMGLPIWLPSLNVEICQSALRDATLRRGGRVNLVVPISIGSCTFIDQLEDVSDCMLEAAVAHLAERWRMANSMHAYSDR